MVVKKIAFFSLMISALCLGLSMYFILGTEQIVRVPGFLVEYMFLLSIPLYLFALLVYILTRKIETGYDNLGVAVLWILSSIFFTVLVVVILLANSSPPPF